MTSALRPTTRNLHVPLPEALHRRLRELASETRRPATELAREAIGRFLDDTRRAAVDAAVAVYASSVAGTAEDLDPALEQAAVQHLLGARRPPGRRKRQSSGRKKRAGER